VKCRALVVILDHSTALSLSLQVACPKAHRGFGQGSLRSDKKSDGLFRVPSYFGPARGAGGVRCCSRISH
jgi:hypothetical protein